MAADLLPLLFFLLVGAAVVALSIWLAARRRKALVAVAQSLGLSFDPRARGLDPGERRLEALSPGSHPRVANEMRGAFKGRQVRCFDFAYTVQSGKNKTTRHRGVAICEVPRSWPRVCIVPETVGHKIADALGADDIDFESQEFSDRFWVRGDDARFAYDVIDPRMMEYLMEPGVTRWEIREGRLAVWQDRHFRPEEIAPALDRLVGFVERVPAHVRAREAA
ncbi:MAG TPA: hypothetical protein VHH36_04375 [Candidatus Thermoplasmatota archaeon]|nr:hypothetical protein [Candidatus Thermoplasmatota archaeon]